MSQIQRAAAEQTGGAPFPDFFLVGAPRCGTTALSKYLSDHEQICFSRPKEPHYFSSVGEDWERRWPSEYPRFFRHYSPEHRAVGEGSVSYLYAEHAIERILRINPDARFIAQVRNPMQMVPSLHLRMLYLLQEDEPNFAKAWELQEARAGGQRIPRHCKDPRVLLYGEVGKLGAQIERLYAQAGRERSLVVVYDDLARDPRKVYEQVLGFLGLDDDGRGEFPRRQPSRTYRWRWLHSVLGQLAVPSGELLHERLGRADRKANKKRLHGWRKRLRPKRIRKAMQAWNSAVEPPAALPEPLRQRLREHFAPDIQKLSALLDRDLTHWV